MIPELFALTSSALGPVELLLNSNLFQIKAFSSATLFSFSLFPVSLQLLGIPELSLNVLQLFGPC